MQSLVSLQVGMTSRIHTPEYNQEPTAGQGSLRQRTVCLAHTRPSVLSQHHIKSNMVTDTYNPNTWEAEAG